MQDLSIYRKDFKMLEREMQGYPLVYLDNSATTLKPKSVLETVVDYYENCSVNVHRGDYAISHEVSTRYEECRAVVGHFINCKSKEVVYTSGTTASINLVAYGYGEKFLREDDVILISEAEHASNVLPWYRCAKVTKAKIEFVPLNEKGQITSENFRKAMHDKVKIVSLAHVSNVLGYVNPIKEICAIAHEYGAKVVVDAAQSIPHMPLDVLDIDCDFLAFSAHKLCGPTGVGVLYGKYDLLQAMDPLLLGGGSNARFDMCGNILLKDAPYKFESGTAPIDGILGLRSAIEYLEKIGMSNIHAYEMELHKYAIDKLVKLDNITIYNKDADSGIITFNVNKVFAQDSATYLSTKGIAVRAGNHCAKILTDFLQTSATVRASLYFYNTFEEIDRFVEVLKDANADTCLNVFF